MAGPKKKKKPAAKKKPAPKGKAKTKKKPAKKAKPTAKKKPSTILPTAAEEARFWSLIEDAWAAQSPAINATRLALAKREPGGDDDAGGEIEEALDGVEEGLRAVFENEDFPKDELVAMDRVLERKLYEIDRADIQAVTDGSDDGFLYARGFIVALGKAFYDAVRANPAMALCDAECESMCYLPAHIHEERFGDFPDTGSGISRETASNGEGWADS